MRLQANLGRYLRASVVIPTAGRRPAALARAIHSVTGQALPIVVLNGTSYDKELRENLSRRRDIKFLYREQASAPAAVRHGRENVSTEFFAGLDDDDELLRNACDVRLASIEGADAVVTSGYIRIDGKDTLNFEDMTRFADDPLRALMTEMWLSPCAALYRTDQITADFWDGMPAYCEWTYFAIALCLRARIRFVNTPTFIYNADSAQSLSKSHEYAVALPEAIQAMMRLPVPAVIRAELQRKYTEALHGASVIELETGDRRAAWRFHLRSLWNGGLRYLPYTRHLLA